MLNSIIKSTIFVLVIGCSAHATVFNVPDDAATIQAAVGKCLLDGDIVELTANTTYTGAGNRNIRLYGKKITVRSEDPTDPQIVASTVIDCQNMGRAFSLDWAETNETVIAGLTIRNGKGNFGGALYFSNNSCAVVTNCVIENSNATIYGGAIAVANYGLVTDQGSSPTIKNCRIIGNSAKVGGGAFHINGGNTVVENCVISNNTALRGGAWYSQNPGNPLISHCTIVGNTANSTGNSSAGAIYTYNASNLTLYGCILWDNSAITAAQMQVGGLGAATTVQISYCDIQGVDANVVVFAPSTVQWGDGNIQTDPMFATEETVAALTASARTASALTVAALTEDDAANASGDFTLVKDSPCIDTGDTSYDGQGKTDVYGIQRVFGEAVDIGASEFPVEELIEAKIKLWPKVINLRGRQNWFFCTIKLDDKKTEDIDTDTIRLQGLLEPVWVKKHKRAKELMVRFRMSEVRDLVPESHAQDSIELTVTGALNNDGMLFKGSQEVKVYQKKQHKHDEDLKKGKGHNKVEDSKDKHKK